MRNITLKDMNISLNFKELFYVNHEDKYEYTEDGKRTDKVIGSAVDVFGVAADGQRKFFTVSTSEILKDGAFNLGQKLAVEEPEVSAWFDRGQNTLRVACKAKKVKAV